MGRRRACDAGTVCIAALATVVAAAIMVAVDVGQYLHWRTPVFASAVTGGADGSPSRSYGLGYVVTAICDGDSRYADMSPIWEASGPCSERAGEILDAVESAVFARHDASVTGYDDGIAGVWVMDCSAAGGTVTAYAMAVERTVHGVGADSVSAERVVLGLASDGELSFRAHDDATDPARSFLDEERDAALFPRYLRIMRAEMRALLR